MIFDDVEENAVDVGAQADVVLFLVLHGVDELKRDVAALLLVIVRCTGSKASPRAALIVIQERVHPLFSDHTR